MAADVYLLIESVNGEFNDDKHRGWIEVHAVDWSVTQPTAGTVSTAGGHTIWHYLGNDALCTLTTIMLVGVVADNMRLRRQLRAMQR